jgi:Transposase IS66 family
VHGAVIHADETEVHLKQRGKGYVWVFTNLEEVVFMYRQSREGSFLHDLLKDFRGVRVSDFYAPYDALACAQQKCLIHLMRDFNHDIQRNPWDEDLKTLAADFGRVLRAVVATIDHYGLRQRHLGKHRRDVEAFFHAVSGRLYRSEVAEGYQRRLLTYQDKLFTFLQHDGVPWNNNNAEHAVKRFAYYREIADGYFSEAGLQASLVLLSLSVTWTYKGLSFFQFLLSREKDIDVFGTAQSRRSAQPTVELVPDAWTFSRRKWSRDWEQLQQQPYRRKQG